MLTSDVVRGEERTRRKLAQGELNPVADFLLSVVIWSLWPLAWIIGKFHDNVMFKFLNKTYIYNVSWEVNIQTKYIFFTSAIILILIYYLL